MQLTIHPSLFEKVPNFTLGVLHYTKTTVSASPQMLKGRLQLFQEQLYFELLDKQWHEFPGLIQWQSTVTSLGANPLTQPSILENKMQEIKERRYTPSFHSAEDLNTFFSLQYEMPIVSYDIEKIVGDIELSIGTAADSYIGLNDQLNTFPNLLLFCDAYSPFGSPHIDSMRTAVTEESKHVLQALFIHPSLDIKEAVQLTESCGKMFTNINGGDYYATVLHSEKNACTLSDATID